MKNIFLIFIIAVVPLMFGSTAIAGNTKSCGCTPQGLSCSIVSSVVEFNWSQVDCADCDLTVLNDRSDKYSVEVRYEDSEGETLMDMDFGTSDRTDGGNIYDPNLDVDVADLAGFLVSCDTDPTIDLKASVKALEDTNGANNERKVKQNNPRPGDCIITLNCTS